MTTDGDGSARVDSGRVAMLAMACEAVAGAQALTYRVQELASSEHLQDFCIANELQGLANAIRLQAGLAGWLIESAHGSDLCKGATAADWLLPPTLNDEGHQS